MLTAPSRFRVLLKGHDYHDLDRSPIERLHLGKATQRSLVRSIRAARARGTGGRSGAVVPRHVRRQAVAERTAQAILLNTFDGMIALRWRGQEPGR